MLHIYHEQQRLVYSFRDLIEVIESAAITFHEITSPEGDEPSGEIRFNLFSSIEKYRISLKSIFSRLIKDLPESLHERYPKLDKLIFLSNHLIEVVALKDLYQTDSGKIKHHATTFTNLATSENLKCITIGTEDVQVYLKAGLDMVNKVEHYVEELKRNVEHTRQEDFVFPDYMIPDPNGATLDNPLAYFEYLINKNGVFALLNDFKPSEDDYENGYISYNNETQIKYSEEQDPETGEWETYTYKFSDHLYNILLKQFKLAKDFIDTSISRSTDKKRIKLSIKLWLAQLNYLKSSWYTNKHLKKYEMLAKPIESLIRFIYEKYGSFSPKPNKLAQSLLENSKFYELPEVKQLALPRSAHPAMFRWVKGNPQANSLLLHGGLNKTFIQDITLDEFHLAFSGGYPDESFTIRWIDKTPNEKHTNKVTLLYLFKKLADHKLIDIEFDTKEMFLRLSRIFRGHEGQVLNNLLQSKSNVLNAKKEETAAKSDLDKIIKVLTVQT